ncbi:hypothetical protein A2U01_0111272, partial [Trifolium medium]|nr:hypothetical protein [Trifolium medium]
NCSVNSTVEDLAATFANTTVIVEDELVVMRFPAIENEIDEQSEQNRARW